VAYAQSGAIEGPPQVAYAVSKRFGAAVQRNRMRRRLRSAIDLLSGQIPPGAYLVTTQPEALSMRFEELIHSLDDCLARASGDRRETK